MRKLILLTILCSTFFGGLTAQNISPEQMDQIKRDSRKNNHITQNYKGRIVRLLFGKSQYGGAFDGLIFRKEDGRLIYAKIFPFYGQDVKPFLELNKEISLTVRGDALLLEQIIYKDEYLISLESDLKEPISGMGHIEEVVSSKGHFILKGIESNYFAELFDMPLNTIINEPVISRSAVDKNLGRIVLANGDTLIMAILSSSDEHFNLREISYLKFDKNTEKGRYYKSLNTYKVYSGTKESDLLKVYSPLIVNSSLLEKISIHPLEFTLNKAGLVNGIKGVSKKYGIQMYDFSTKEAKSVMAHFDIKNGDSLKFHFSTLGTNKHLKAIEKGAEQLILRYDLKEMQEDYSENLESISGEISTIFYADKKKKSSFRALILNDSSYIKISDLLAISIAKLVKNGKTIKIEGWKRKELDTEINQLGYSIYIPSKITIDGKTFTSKVNLANDL
jgi:hypothetical protein